MPTDNALEWIEDHVTLLFSLFSKTLPEQNSFSIIVAKNGWGLVLWIFIDMQYNPQWPKRVKTEKKLTGSKIGAIFCKIASRITTQNLKIGP